MIKSIKCVDMSRKMLWVTTKPEKDMQVLNCFERRVEKKKTYRER